MTSIRIHLPLRRMLISHENKNKQLNSYIEQTTSTLIRGLASYLSNQCAIRNHIVLYWKKTLSKSIDSYVKSTVFDLGEFDCLSVTFFADVPFISNWFMVSASNIIICYAFFDILTLFSYQPLESLEVPVMLQLWGMHSSPPLPSLHGLFWLGVGSPDRALSKG